MILIKAALTLSVPLAQCPFRSTFSFWTSPFWTSAIESWFPWVCVLKWFSSRDAISSPTPTAGPSLALCCLFFFFLFFFFFFSSSIWSAQSRSIHPKCFTCHHIYSDRHILQQIRNPNLANKPILIGKKNWKTSKSTSESWNCVAGA